MKKTKYKEIASVSVKPAIAATASALAIGGTAALVASKLARNRKNKRSEKNGERGG